MLRYSAFLGMLFLAVAGTANAQGAAGHWKGKFDSDIRTERDTFKVLHRAEATLDLVQRGDSVSGVWRAGNLDSTLVRGTFDGRSLKLTSGLTERKIRINGQPASMKVRTDIVGIIEGGKARGTMLIYMGDRAPAPRRWEAERLR